MIKPNYLVWFGSEHADIIANGVCDGVCYFDATDGVHEIFIRELK